MPLGVKKVLWMPITLKLSEQPGNPFKPNVTWSYMMVLWLIWTLEVPCDKSWCFLCFWPPSNTPTICCYHIPRPLPFIKSAYIWVVCDVNRNGRVAWVMYVKISKNRCLRTKQGILKVFIEYSETMGASREKSKRGVRYTSYLSILFDISWLGVYWMMKWMFWMQWKSAFWWPNSSSWPRPLFWSL